MTEQPQAGKKSMEDSVTFLSPHLICPFRRHPFRLYEGERLDDFVASVSAHGILTPVIVRKIEQDENGYEYEMLAGHNRRNAAMLIGLEYIPCIVKENLSDEEAWIYVIETNVLQRSFSDMLPSEKAAVLSIQYSKMFSQGKRNDIIEELKKLNKPDYSRENISCGSDFHKLKNRDKLGEAYDLTGRAVANYVRAATLIDPLKNRLDNKELTLTISVTLSYLSETEQQVVESVLSENEYNLDGKKAALLRSYAGRLDKNLTEQILSGEKMRKPKSNAPPPFKLKAKIYSKYFKPDTKATEIEQVIDEALSLYFSQRKQKGV
ncbi:ParB N-terminal domain-containing protein [Fumia xinanensis]|uniref:ParB N-terminal domain-containing protein n=1 Tax=Fumia xinanensis TaxID=2763659 RepID=UPI002015FB90|nr:ParB N-terminal domain-containing protein [Fumia xinanensis]